jgi:hypothetical protein
MDVRHIHPTENTNEIATEQVTLRRTAAVPCSVLSPVLFRAFRWLAQDTRGYAYAFTEISTVRSSSS